MAGFSLPSVLFFFGMIILLKPYLKISMRGLLLRVAMLWQRQLKFAAKLGHSEYQVLYLRNTLESFL